MKAAEELMVQGLTSDSKAKKPVREGAQQNCTGNEPSLTSKIDPQRILFKVEDEALEKHCPCSEIGAYFKSSDANELFGVKI